MTPLAILLAIAPASVEAQAFQAALSRDTVAMGEVFELRVRVPVPPASVVYFPDTVATTEVLESHAPVVWTAEAAAGGGATLFLTYPVIAWGAGVVPVPGFDVFVAPAGAPAGAEALPGGSYVGAWTDAPVRGGADVRPLRVPRRGVSVAPVFGEDQMEAGVEPMPSADVVGTSWHWPSVALGLLFGGALAGLGFLEWRRAMEGARRGGRSPWSPAESKRVALEQLDRLLTEALPAAGHAQELYTRSSGIVRTYVGRMDSDLGADLTSSELITHLRRRANGSSNGRPESDFFREMSAAEVVKFGRARPADEEARAHILSLRAWVVSRGDSL